MNPFTKSTIPKILYEDSHILVCIKPHGVATQSRQIGRPDMVNLLKNHIHHNTPDKGEPYLAVIHRLDQPVTGILVFAKSPFAAKELNRQLQHQGFGKYYRALVEGCPPKKSDTLEDYMTKDRRANQSFICSRDTSGARIARLHYSIVSDERRYFTKEDALSDEDRRRDESDAFESSDRHGTPGSCTELDIRLDTGRHHQIRVQMAHMGCPIIGDTKYNPRCANASRTSTAWQDICLCAYRLDFCHPKTQKPLHFHMLSADSIPDHHRL